MDRPAKKILRCAIYTRKSTDHNLDLEFNSLDAQREACEAYIKSQAHEGWRQIPDHYDDGAFSGASLDRPALQLLLSEVRAGKVGELVRIVVAIEYPDASDQVFAEKLLEVGEELYVAARDIIEQQSGVIEEIVGEFMRAKRAAKNPQIFELTKEAIDRLPAVQSLRTK